MAKDPAFLFYSQDFYTGVATLTIEDRGKYITLLCLMHQQGRMTEETIRFLVGSVSVNLKSKFRIDENGFWYNERLEIESEKRAKFTESRRNNGLAGGRPKSHKKAKKVIDRWNEMIDFFDNKCICCGYKFHDNERPTKDHIIPKSSNGVDNISNWQPLCRECNSSKCADHNTDYRLNFIDQIPEELKTIWFNKNNHMEDENENENRNKNIDIIKAENSKIVKLPFESERFKKAWEYWISYKKQQFKQTYKSESSEQIAVNHLFKLANSNEETAINIIAQSVTNTWQGLFALKQSANYKPTVNDKLKELIYG